MINKLENQTILDFQQGDEKAFELVFKSYFVAILLFINKLIDNREDAEDIAMTVFSALFKRCNLFNTEANIKAFLYISARNSSLNYIKAKQRDRQKIKEFAERMKDDTFLEYEHSIKAVVVEAIDLAIETLPEECRKIFKMLYYEELTPAEVAEVLQISINTVYTQRRRAVQTLRLLLSENTLAIAWLIHTIALLQFKIPPPGHLI